MAFTGGITPVDGSANSLEIETLAQFAVEDHNKKENALLDFGKVVSVKQQVVYGTMYYVTLEAKDGEQNKVYQTKIWVQPWMNFKQVEEFKYLGDAPVAGDCNT